MNVNLVACLKTICGKCDEPLVDGILKTDDGLSECPVGYGKIKSPLCLV